MRARVPEGCPKITDYASAHIAHTLPFGVGFDLHAAELGRQIHFQLERTVDEPAEHHLRIAHPERLLAVFEQQMRRACNLNLHAEQQRFRRECDLAVFQRNPQGRPSEASMDVRHFLVDATERPKVEQDRPACCA